MARMVRSDRYPERTHTLPPMPDVCQELLARYQNTLKDRLEVLPANDEETIHIPRKSKRVEMFRHQLRCDAESVFWCLL